LSSCLPISSFSPSLLFSSPFHFAHYGTCVSLLSLFFTLVLVSLDLSVSYVVLWKWRLSISIEYH
jgi:hypothetical protein